MTAGVLALAIAGCGSGDSGNSAAQASGGFPMTVRTCAGAGKNTADKLVKFDSSPKRIVTVGPDSAVGVAAAGAAGKVVARSRGIFSDLSEFGAYGLPSVPRTFITTLGMRNVFDDLNKRANDISVETLISRDPDVLILITDSGETEQQALDALLKEHPQLKGLKAIRNDRAVLITYTYSVGGPLIVDGPEQIAQALENEHVNK